MTKESAREYGEEVGFDIGRENLSAYEHTDKERFLEDCHECESEHFRQFSPFEFYASEFNKSKDPDGTWEAYESGVTAGIERAWAEGWEVKV